MRLLKTYYRKSLVLPLLRRWITRPVTIIIAIITCDAHRLRETLVESLFGTQYLSKGNFRFYRHLCKHVIDEKTDLIVDVGANDGWFARSVYRFLPHARILSFEPLQSQESSLRKLARKCGPSYNYVLKAVGSVPCTATIIEHRTSGLSSLRPLASKYQYDPRHYNTDVVDQYSVSVTTLDDELRQSSGPIVLKIDTQGYEMEVLQGASRLFERNQIRAVVVEMCTLTKYSGQALYSDIVAFLTARGFQLFDVYASYYEGNSGQLTELDAVFILPNEPSTVATAA